MSNRIHELLHRNLQEVFGEGDAARRRVAIDELCTEDCVPEFPPGIFFEREALDKFTGGFRATDAHMGILPPTNKQMDAPCCDVFRLVNGKIQSFNCYPSGTVIFAQLGVLSNIEAAIAHS
jgi:hypothetical protein